VRARDYDFAYEERGRGPPLVLVHGELTDSRAFAPVMNALSKTHRVISYSRRYHWPNEQAKSGIGYSYTEHADDLVTVLTALGLDRADVLGDGYGAGVVLLAATRNPDRFLHVVLIDPEAPELISDAKIAKVLLERQQAVTSEAKRLYKPDDPRAALRLVIDAEYGSGTFDGAGQELRALWQQNAATIPLRVGDTPGIDCERAKSIAAPMLLLRGARTPDANRAISRALERCVKQAQAIEIADAGHALQREQPGSFVAAVEIFLGAN
jgi:pimeloyl-ACP methyl ester carboxylesterase